jgi:Protein of unknown function (DUF4232)
MQRFGQLSGQPSGHLCGLRRPPSRPLRGSLPRAGLALTTVLLALAATACGATPTGSPATAAGAGASSSGGSGSGTMPSSASSAVSSPAPTSAGSAGSSTGAGMVVTPRWCATRDLRASLHVLGAAAGSRYVRVDLTNTSGHLCRTGGFGGVSFVGGGNGSQLGAPATREGTPRTVVLAPGASAGARLQEGSAENYDPARCRITPADGLRVYPPNNTASLFVADRAMACRDASVHLLTLRPYRLLH